MTTRTAKDLRIAVIGAGFISDYHVNGLRAAGAERIELLVGRSASKTRARATALGIAQVETDYRAVLANDAVDAVVIATPDATHKDIAIEALDAGKPTLLQKPMALSSTQCLEILSAARRSSVPLTVSFMHRHFPEVRWLRNLLNEGHLGRIHSVRLRNATPGADWADWFFSVENVSGGVVMQLGVHGIDLVEHLFGSIEEVSADATTKKPCRMLADGRSVISKLEDNVLAHYRLASGASVTHEMSYTEVGGCDRFRLEVYAERGTVWLRSELGKAALIAPDMTGTNDWTFPSIADEPLGQHHHAQWLETVSAAGLKNDRTDIAGLKTLLVAEALYAAAKTGHRTLIDRPPLCVEDQK